MSEAPRRPPLALESIDGGFQAPNAQLPVAVCTYGVCVCVSPWTWNRGRGRPSIHHASQASNESRPFHPNGDEEGFAIAYPPTPDTFDRSRDSASEPNATD